MTDLYELMKQARMMQEQMQKAQKDLAEQIVEGESGAGLVKISMNGRHDVTRVNLDPGLLEEDKEIVSIGIRKWGMVFVSFLMLLCGAFDRWSGPYKLQRDITAIFSLAVLAEFVCRNFLLNEDEEDSGDQNVQSATTKYESIPFPSTIGEGIEEEE